ncbi:origin recognition complex subunit 5 [Aplysia californica]|uniref:Origin recognition complex subunit 5 n=1 Tax=Aplysia californica TaxID=6500 RepID=A0ABM0JBL6_APLCA|nr:origin recognition complex subunit 5 [Aplysia californica]XP_005089926.1 origin recognition complex subunit 5 [Aplysia californica]
MEIDLAPEPPSEGVADLTLGSQVRCRKYQVQTLLSLFGQRQHMTPGALFVYGHTATGKSLVVQTLLSYHKLPHILINCVECSSPRVLFEHILNNIPQNPDADIPDCDDDDEEEYIQCDDMTSFVRQLTNIVSEKPFGEQTLYIVLDKAERLRDSHIFMLPALLRLQELTGLNICTILISEIVWEKFRFGTGFNEPYCLHFPDYSRHELMEIMCLDSPSTCDKELYSMYINIVLSVFHMVCRDLRELRHLAKLNFPYFIEPVLSGEADATQTRKLWRNIEPHLKKALKSVYLREVSSQQWEKMQQAELENPDLEQTLTPSHRCQVELPYYSKFLLIAAYLASYNPMKYDRRFFAKNAGKVSKRSKLVKKNERASNHLLGPKVFPIDRLMAIFYSIVEGKVVPSAHIYVQISSLVSLHLLSQVKGEDRIGMPKYKCLITLDFIRSIARTVQFDVMRYLYDFL